MTRCRKVKNFLAHSIVLTLAERFFAQSGKSSQLCQFLLKSARQNRKPAPGAGVYIEVVEVKGRSNALPFPLVAAPQPEKPPYVVFQQLVGLQALGF